MRAFCLYAAWLISLFGVSLSLYVGEILEYVPCPLCWYQRIALFPLAWILGFAAYHNDRKGIAYAFPLALIAFFFASFQILSSHFPSMMRVSPCGLGVSCNESGIVLWGMLDLPWMSAIGSFLILFFLFFARKDRKE